MIETCWSEFKCFNVWHFKWCFITNKCISWTITYSKYSSNFILLFSVYETTSRAAFHRWKGCILLIAWKGHSSIQHVTAVVALRPIPGHGLPLQGFVITHTGHTTLGRTPLDEWSARRRDRYLVTHNIHNSQTSMARRDSNPHGHWDRHAVNLQAVLASS
jgi:hypothetical protein